MIENKVTSEQLTQDADTLISAYLGSPVEGSFFTRERGVMGVAANVNDGCVDVIVYAHPDSEDASNLLRDASFLVSSPVRIL